MSLTEKGKIIFNANEAWNDLYYDEFNQQDSYQASWVDDADRPYYNCIHIDQNLNLEDLNHAENFFYKKLSPPRIYTHTNTDSTFIHLLERKGYVELVEEEEIWYEYSTEHLKAPLNVSAFYKGNSSEIRIRKIDTNSVDLETFMSINQRQNNIPAKLADKFVEKIRHCCRKKSNTLSCFAAFNHSDMLSIGTFSTINEKVFLSEGATHSDYRRLGLYSILLAHRINLAYENGPNPVYVRCDKHAWSNHACKKLGFKQLFTRHLWQKV